MSRRVVAYEGVGRHRRPVFSDPLTVALPSNPPGPVQRRQASAEERAGFAPRITSPGLSVAPRRPRVARAEDLTPPQRELVTALVNADRSTRGEPPIRLPEPEPEEDPAMADAAPSRSPESQALADLTAAASRTDAAWERFHTADVERILAEEEYELARRDLARAIAAVGEAMALERADIELPEPPADGHERYTGRGTTIDEAIADLGLPTAEPADDAPEVVTRPPTNGATAMAKFAAGRAERADRASPEPGRPLTKQDRILAAIVPHRGDLAIIANLERTDRGNVNATLHNAGKKGRLTADMIAVLPAAFAKYSAAR